MKKIFPALAAIWLALNLLTLTGYPAVWVDEILSADAGIHLARAQGFVSSGWFNQTSHEFWASYPPLYAFLLAIWLAVFPITAFFVRAFSLALVCTSLVLLYRAIESQLDETASWIVVAALAVCEPLAFLERPGRPDSVSFALFACTVYVLVFRRRQTWLLFALGALAVPAALQYAAFMLVLGALVQIWFRWLTRREVFIWLAGMLSGSAVLAALYASQHVLRIFLQSTVASKHSSAGRMLQSILLKNGEVPFVSSDILSAPLRDHSSPIVIAAGVIAWVWAKQTGKAWAARAASFGVTCGVVIPLAIQILGKYPIYYAYMGAVPAIIAILAAYSLLGLTGKRVSVLVLIAVAFTGAAQFWWKAKGQGSQSTAELAQLISPSDTVVVDYPVYYDFLGRTKEIFAIGYAGGKVLPRFPQDQAARVTKLIVRDSLYPELVKRVGGNWRLLADIVVLRQDTPTDWIVIDDDTRHPVQEHIGLYLRQPSAASPEIKISVPLELDAPMPIRGDRLPDQR